MADLKIVSIAQEFQELLLFRPHDTTAAFPLLQASSMFTEEPSTVLHPPSHFQERWRAAKAT
jgi:hypothetical protein